MQNEGVVVIRNFSEHCDFGCDDLLDPGANSIRIVIAIAVDHDSMRHAENAEIDLLKVINFEWGVVKNVEIFSAKTIRFALNGRQAGSNFPARRRNYLQR